MKQYFDSNITNQKRAMEIFKIQSDKKENIVEESKAVDLPWRYS